MKKAVFGAITALITPFKNGKLDEVGYGKLIKRQIKLGIDAVSPVGTTGESATLTHEEHRTCIQIAVEACKGSEVKVLAGAGSNATHEAVDLAKFAQKAGADGILSVAPYYNKPTQEGLFAHYKEIANSVQIPVLLYNVPGRTGSDIQPSTAIRLFDECENIYGIKEASGNIERCVELLARKSEIYVLSGDDAINYPVLANGGKGVVSVSANILPDLISQMTRLALAGEFSQSRKINEELFEINKILFIESNPIPIKAAMFVAGLIDSLEYRLPLCAPSKANLEQIEKVIKHYEIKGF